MEEDGRQTEREKEREKGVKGDGRVMGMREEGSGGRRTGGERM